VDAYPHLYYGAQRLTHLLARELPARGWTAEVVTPGPGLFVDRLREDGVPVSVVRVPPALLAYGGVDGGRPTLGPAAALPVAWWRFARLLRQRGAAVVHANDHRGALLAGPAARAVRVPLVWHVHYTQPTRLVTVATGRLATEIVVCSRSTATGTPGLERWRTARVVPNPLPGPPVDRHEPDLPPVVATAGRLHADKGVDVLLRALAQLRARGCDVRGLVLGDAIAGQASYRDALHALAADLGLAAVVDFAGYVPDPSARWAGASVYVQASRHEPFGLAAIEAMASGLAVVATAVGGLADLVADGETGLLVPPDDPGALSAAIERLLTDPLLAGRLAAAGRRHVLATYTPDRFVDGVVEAYEAALA
jgi:glycosyltransferase involved in cell wall biosynthesis